MAGKKNQKKQPSEAQQALKTAPEAEAKQAEKPAPEAEAKQAEKPALEAEAKQAEKPAPEAAEQKEAQRGVPQNEPIFREKSLRRLSAPEQLNDYLHVTTPHVWSVLAAVILIVAGLFIWSSFAVVNSYANGRAVVQDGVLTITFQDATQAQNVKADMQVLVGSTKAKITSVGKDEQGRVVASATSDGLADGTYDVSVSFKQTQILKFLFN